MNKYTVLKLLAKTPEALPSPAQEILKLAALIAATCLASKIEEIVRDVIEANKLPQADIFHEINMKKEEM